VDGYLLDTCFLSALLNARHDNYEVAQRTNEAIQAGEPRYVSRITIAELTFGFLLDHAATGRPHPKATEILRRAENFKILEITNHTAVEYAEIRKKMAVTYLPTLLRSQRPRWIDQWPSRVRQETLQIDENDLWICAQARERNLVLLTSDRNMFDRFSKADPDIRFQVVPAPT
jgi:predicted nucleic acid-binding protein